MMKVAVGCPIRDRAWIFPWWVQHVRATFAVAGLRPHWVFAIGIGPNDRDDGTRRLVSDLYKEDDGIWCEIPEPERTTDRAWSTERFTEMADCRNQLLGLVQAIEPDYFLSVDSDILLHPTALKVLLDSIQQEYTPQGIPTRYDAMGGKAILSMTSRHITTYGQIERQGFLQRQDADGTFQVDVLMALKLMSPAAYHICYKGDRNGEDLGWSENCRAAGLKLGWNGSVMSKHVMSRSRLHTIDPRIGW